MPELFIVLGILLFVAASVLILSYICFYRTFYASKSGRTKESNSVTAPVVANFMPFREQIGAWARQTETMPHKDVEIVSFDGLCLRGTYYEYAKGAPIEIMFHGYRGNAHRDLSGGVIRAAKHKRSTLIVNHRASGESEGRVVTFGINESRDCRQWIDYVIDNIDSDAKIIITGISMGAATVMITAGREDLPKNVVGVIADCGYSSPREIIKKTIREMNLPPNLLYPFVKLGGKLFGKFDIDEISPEEAMKKCRVPVIFIHGEKDDFVPYEMSVKNYEACASEKKKLVGISEAGHGVAYPTDPEKYLLELEDFFKDVLGESNEKE